MTTNIVEAPKKAKIKIVNAVETPKAIETVEAKANSVEITIWEPKRIPKTLLYFDPVLKKEFRLTVIHDLKWHLDELCKSERLVRDYQHEYSTFEETGLLTKTDAKKLNYHLDKLKAHIRRINFVISSFY
jgi:hypothetical protein